MSFQLTRRVIKLLCGERAYELGDISCQAGDVTITHTDPDHPHYEATVQGTTGSKVSIEIDLNGDVHATCTCPSAGLSSRYCEHIAAVLIKLHFIQQEDGLPAAPRPGASRLQAEGPYERESGLIRQRTDFASARRSGNSGEDSDLTGGMLGLFSEKPMRPTGSRPFFDNRTPLQVEFVCKPVSYGFGKVMFGIEMRVGLKRPYIVQPIQSFLERVDRRQPFPLSKQFIYDPELHSFQERHDAVIRQLIQISRNENMYREAANPYAIQPRKSKGERQLLIPPISWEALLPLLASAPSVQLEYEEGTYEGIRVSEEPLPLDFEFDEADSGGYVLNVRGMERITVMESYGIVLSEGKLLKLQDDALNRLVGMMRMLEPLREHQVRIPPEQMELFMENVIPGLMKLGSVRIAQTVSDRLVRTPLEAKLYLDRVKSRLLAGLEFQYGDIVFNPLEGNRAKGGSGRILMRDGEKERRIFELLEQGSFARTESGYFLDDEDAEFDFLYTIVPQLEKLLKVYATSAVKVRIVTKHAPPKITVDVDDRIEWLEFRFDMAGIPDSDIRELLMSLEEKRKYYRLPNGALMPLDSAEFQEMIRLLNEVGIRNADVTGSQFRLPVVRGLHLSDSTRQGNVMKLGKSLRRLLENMRNPDHLDFPVPAALDTVLRDYQKFGYQWMKTVAHYRFGGILADDMGLGKTLQSIAFLVSALPEIRSMGMPALVVAPASLMYNWRNELTKFAPEIRAVIADGSRADRRAILREMPSMDVIITSYPLIRRDIDLYSEHAYHTLLLDEAQAFKNYSTQTAQVVKLLQARHRFALTGTPIENSLEELWSIFEVVFPGLFPDRKAFNELSRESVARRIRPFLLRRLKTDVLKELPEKIESLQASELLPDQKKLYTAYLAKLRQETLQHLNENGFQKNRIKILAGLTRLRQLCCHPALFVEGYDGSSAKFEQLLELVEECRSAGKRMLVFSQFTEMLGLIARELGRQGVPHFYLDGKTPAEERVELCSRFNDGERELFLISLKAGGTGLNLTGADTVILYDLWWNPAVEQQAADRAYRIGQKNVVQVIRLVSQGTVEDKMYLLQQKKKNLIEEVIQPGQETLSELTEEDIRDILMIG
ncbi:MAG: helicase [Paenibacillus sp.]|nr:helicase [Paenibacillus sp.]